MSSSKHRNRGRQTDRGRKGPGSFPSRYILREEPRADYRALGGAAIEPGAARVERSANSTAPADFEELCLTTYARRRQLVSANAAARFCRDSSRNRRGRVPGGRRLAPVQPLTSSGFNYASRRSKSTQELR